ncbi:MAG: hypothetical protein ACRDHZ_00400 [Ktedonobacteraceae bacterium]
MAQHNTEQRLAAIEEQISLLLRFKEEQELAKQEQEAHDIALLARIDSLSEDMRRIERVQIRGFEETRAGHKYANAVLDTIEDEQTRLVEIAVNHTQAINTLLEGQQAHKEAIKSLQESQQQLLVGQQQIIEMLMGKPRRND